MLVALDVGYESTGDSESGRCGVVAFDDWDSTESNAELAVTVSDVGEYVSGQFFKRELPCLVAGLDALQTSLPSAPLRCVIVDGNVRLDNRGRAGLGLHLHRHLDESVPVVGVAKRPFPGLSAVQVLRGSGSKALHVTAVGIDEDEAGRLVASMAGDFRLPTMIRRADQLARGL